MTEYASSGLSVTSQGLFFMRPAGCMGRSVEGLEAQVEGNKRMLDLEEYITVQYVCNHLKIKERTVYKICAISSFPAIKIGKTYRINKNQYEKWLKSNIGKTILL